GRIRSYRDLSTKLIFYDVVQDGRKLQGVSSHALIGGTNEEFYERTTALRIGDIISVTGFPGRSNTGELSLYATEHPKLLAPCLHPIPDSLQNPEKIKHHRHLDLLVHPEAAQTLKLRSRILKMIRSALTKQDFIEVQTPILSSSAGGAIAKPFLTTASSSSRTLALRIAPELWLKRLIVGGLDRVFELGPQFRNEGIDNTHNPEFTTCEAYISYGRLADVIKLTESLFRDVGRMATQLKEPLGMCYALNPLDADIAEALNYSFKQLEFIPTLEAELGEPLPDLEGKNAAKELKALCERHKVPVDSNTPAKMLDKLAQHFLEPMCYLPTFITHHPACMSPLAKSHMRRGRLVSERVELFIQEQELVNAYEEENSPREQRRKFKLQMESEGKELQTSSTEGTSAEEGELEEGIDESYCSTLEWGMPPTAGWGLGVDRMVMLFSGQDRIADVLAFGGLRGAVNQG
ncbi:class II aaRS and biotin synthetase, partial [Wilcoxina mikolae CBS 423.85]